MHRSHTHHLSVCIIQFSYITRVTIYAVYMKNVSRQKSKKRKEIIIFNIKKNKRESRKENDDQPGKAIKASECLAISAFLWCISATAFTSPTVSPVICAYIWVHHYTIIIVYSTANLLSQCKNTHTASQSKTQLLTLKLLAPGPHKWIALRRTDTLIQSWLSPETIGGGSSLGAEVGGKGIIICNNIKQEWKKEAN